MRENRLLERCGLRRAQLTQEARMRLEEYVQRARSEGASWQAVGAALGISRQSAWERFRGLPDCAVKGTRASKLPRLPSQRHAAKHLIDDKIQKCVQQMRAGGASWQTVGAALGISRQSAWERFRGLPDCAVKGTTTSSLTEPHARRYASKQERREEIEKRFTACGLRGRVGRPLVPRLG
jgi:biotin operon repressor